MLKGKIHPGAHKMHRGLTDRELVDAAVEAWSTGQVEDVIRRYLEDPSKADLGRRASEHAQAIDALAAEIEHYLRTTTTKEAEGKFRKGIHAAVEEYIRDAIDVEDDPFGKFDNVEDRIADFGMYLTLRRS
jgi:hypothetical protein